MISRVLDGGAGELKPGTDERSTDNGDLDLLPDSEPGDKFGDTGGDTCSPLVCRGGNCTATDISACGVGVLSCGLVLSSLCV